MTARYSRIIHKNVQDSKLKFFVEFVYFFLKMYIIVIAIRNEKAKRYVPRRFTEIFHIANDYTCPGENFPELVICMRLCSHIWKVVHFSTRSAGYNNVALCCFLFMFCKVFLRPRHVAWDMPSWQNTSIRILFSWISRNYLKYNHLLHFTTENNMPSKFCGENLAFSIAKTLCRIACNIEPIKIGLKAHGP